MNLLTQLLRQYWLNLLAIGVFGAAVWQYVELGRWEQNLVPLAVAFFSFVCVVASSEVADWTGNYGWTRQQWRRFPEAVLQFAGAVALVIATVVLYRR